VDAQEPRHGLAFLKHVLMRLVDRSPGHSHDHQLGGEVLPIGAARREPAACGVDASEVAFDRMPANQGVQVPTRLGGGIPAIAATLFRIGRNDAPQPVGRTADTQFGLLADDLRVGGHREADAEAEEGDERRKPQAAHHGLALVIDERRTLKVRRSSPPCRVSRSER